MSPCFIVYGCVSRNPAPPVADPHSGGWGSIRDKVSFTLNTDVLSFSAPVSTISSHREDLFSYTLQTYQYGKTIDSIDPIDVVAVTPEPSSMLLLTTGLLGLSE